MSITKLKERNIEVANSLLNDQEGGLNVDNAVAHSNAKLQLPLLFVECQPDSRIKISQDDTKMHLKLSTDRKFALSDENYLFEWMGLTKTTSEELSRMFEPQIIRYLKQSELVQALPKDAANKATAKSQKAEGGADYHEIQGNLDGQQMRGNHHTPITKFLSSSQQPQQADDCAGQPSALLGQGYQNGHMDSLAYPYHKGKNAGPGYALTGGELGGHESMGTQHTSNGLHQQHFS